MTNTLDATTPSNGLPVSLLPFAYNLLERFVCSCMLLSSATRPSPIRFSHCSLHIAKSQGHYSLHTPHCLMGFFLPHIVPLVDLSALVTLLICLASSINARQL
ncbi:hypothetical protein FKM82_027412 [Ascaphus truei]